MRLVIGMVLLLACSPAVYAKGVYKTLDQFISDTFPQGFEQHILWYNDALKKTIAKALEYSPSGLRVRYWTQSPEQTTFAHTTSAHTISVHTTAAHRTAWVLDEIGKELPITIGVVVSDEGIDGLEILEFRESRGGEVRHSFFTEQFNGARLNEDWRLDRNIDGITGATLSVNAVRRVAALALFLHQHVRRPQP